jgi:xanthine dehydrogenase accessory factor
MGGATAEGGGMSFDVAGLGRLIAAHGPVVRVVIAEVQGSSPRGPGTAMVVWADGQDGTIGGGALEWEATARARALLAEGCEKAVERMPLGPALGQCCGGAVLLLMERWDSIEGLGEVIARPLRGAGAIPLAVTRMIATARGQGRLPPPGVVSGWMVEPAARPTLALWVWGAGHVGRAVVQVMAPLPDFAITWVDSDAARFPEAVPAGVTVRIAPNPGDLVSEAPVGTEHLILTYSHALDLDLCHRLLGHGFRSAGLIGSATKWARFRSRLAALGHSQGQIDRIACPIGDPALGKHPQAIALGVATGLVRAGAVTGGHKECAG